jgi:hypothetical protein
VTILILILAPWLFAVLLVLAACHGASAGEDQLRVLPRDALPERRSRPDRMDRSRPDRVDVAS